MLHYWKKAVAIAFLTFLGLWVIGVVRSADQPYPEPVTWHLSSGEEYYSNVGQVANNLKQLGLAQRALPFVLDQPNVEQIQVYERTAQLTAGSAAFESDAAQIRGFLTAHQAVVFNEKNSGVEPGRRLTLEIGVLPEKFDDLVSKLRQIGHLESVSVQQRDRTSEFRRLHAQHQSLKKHLEAVEKLRGTQTTGVGVDDKLKLEQKIQDIEKELQTLSAQVGDLLGKESYYHVNVTLYEYQPGSRLDHTFTFPRRIANAFVWALAWWTAGVGVLALLTGVYLSIVALWPRTSALAARSA